VTAAPINLRRALEDNLQPSMEAQVKVIMKLKADLAKAEADLDWMTRLASLCEMDIECKVPWEQEGLGDEDAWYISTLGEKVDA